MRPVVRVARKGYKRKSLDILAEKLEATRQLKRVLNLKGMIILK
jgi:hypothetical protein